MRWLSNTILIVVCIGLITILYKAGDINYTGLVFQEEQASSSIVINYPNNLQTINTSSVKISFSVVNWTIQNKGGNHVHFYLDNDSIAYMFYNNTVEYNIDVTSNATWINISTIQFNNLINGSHNVLAFLAVGNHVDIQDANDSIVFIVNTTILTITNLNFISNIPNFNTSEDRPLNNIFDLDDYFTIPSGTIFAFKTNTSNSVNFSVNSEKKVTITPYLNWNGIVSANVTATYNNLSNISNNFIVNVTPVNDPPLLYEPIPNLNWSENFERINLDDYFKEIEGQDLTYFADDTEHIQIIIDGHDAEFRQEAGWSGSERAIIYANDSSGLVTASNEFTLMVTSSEDDDVVEPSGNVAPTLSGKNPSESSVSISKGGSKSFSINARDNNNDTLTYRWTVNSILQSSTSNSFSFTPTNEGSYHIQVDVGDGWYTESESWDVVVTAPAQQQVGTTPSTPQQRSQVIEKPSNTMSIVIMAIIVMASLAVIGALVFKFVIKKKEPKPTIEVKSTVDESVGSDIENEFIAQLKGEELGPLINFIKKYKSKGVKEDKIRFVLLKKGWKKDQVEEAFSMM